MSNNTPTPPNLSDYFALTAYSLQSWIDQPEEIAGLVKVAPPKERKRLTLFAIRVLMEMPSEEMGLLLTEAAEKAAKDISAALTKVAQTLRLKGRDLPELPSMTLEALARDLIGKGPVRAELEEAGVLLRKDE